MVLLRIRQYYGNGSPLRVGSASSRCWAQHWDQLLLQVPALHSPCPVLWDLLVLLLCVREPSVPLLFPAQLAGFVLPVAALRAVPEHLCPSCLPCVSGHGEDTAPAQDPAARGLLSSQPAQTGPSPGHSRWAESDLINLS